MMEFSIDPIKSLLFLFEGYDGKFYLDIHTFLRNLLEEKDPEKKIFGLSDCYGSSYYVSTDCIVGKALEHDLMRVYKKEDFLSEEEQRKSSYRERYCYVITLTPDNKKKVPKVLDSFISPLVNHHTGRPGLPILESFTPLEIEDYQEVRKNLYKGLLRDSENLKWEREAINRLILQLINAYQSIERLERKVSTLEKENLTKGNFFNWFLKKE